MAINTRLILPDQYLATQLPALQELILSDMESWPDMVPTLAKIRPATGSIAQTTEQTGVGQAQAIPEGASVNYATIAQGNSFTAQYIKYGIGAIITREMMEDGKLQDAAEIIRSLPRSMHDLKQRLFADNFNNGFTVNGYDGVPLFSTNHPIVNGGGVQANTPSVQVDLTVDSLEEGFTQISQWVTQEGLRWMAKPEYMLVSPGNSYGAYQLLNSDYTPDSANNAVSSVKRFGLKMVESPYITDTDAWFIRCTQHYLFWWDRQDPMLESFPDFDITATKHKITARWTTGHGSYYGWYGSRGN